MKTADSIRADVRDSYAKAVTSGGGCCGPREMKGVAVKIAGYRPEELAALPDEAVANAFGCGNPLAFAEVREGETVLDLGSGAGIDLLLAARRVGPRGRVIGVDMTDEMIARARANAAAAGFDNIEIRKGLIEALPVEDASVDWVISNCVINLSPEKPRVFAEISRVLRPGGRISISDIVAEGIPEALRQNLSVYSACLGGAISEPEYLAGLRAAGLEEAEVTERMQYTGAQIAALVESEVSGSGGSCGCGGGDLAALVRAFAPTFEGKVWSARIRAHKPAA